jgi:hypothetical protein
MGCDSLGLDNKGESKLIPQVVCILGMHRGGTSLVSSIVNFLDFDLGPEKHWIRPWKSHRRAFCGHQAIMDLNDAILARFGGRWYEPPEFPDGWETSSDLNDLRAQARQLIDADFSKSGAWAWKDPRACLTLPFWQGVLPPMHYVIVLRSPADVARSLHQRDGLAYERSARLWLRYLQSALGYTAGAPRMILSYEDCVNEWQSEYERLCRFLGRTESQERIVDSIRQVIEAEPFPNGSELMETLDDPKVVFPAKALYVAARLCACVQRIGSASTNMPSECESGLRDLSIGASQAQTAFQNLESQVAALQREVDHLVAALQKREKQIEQLRSDRDLLQRESASLNGVIEGQRASLEMVSGSIAWLFTSRFRQVKDRVLSPGTKRRVIYDRLLQAAKRRLRDPRVQVGAYPAGLKAIGDSDTEFRGMPLLERKRELPTEFVNGRCSKFAIYSSSIGNYFFTEIRDLIGSALEELGFETELANERKGFLPDADWHIVIAPHEFFYLGEGEALAGRETPSNLVLFNTEQPSTQWFSHAQSLFNRASRVWDIHYGSALELSRQGQAADFLPLGYVSQFSLFNEVNVLPEHRGTIFLEESIRSQTYWNRAFFERPIDVLFIGTLSARREEFFAKASPILSKYRCYLHLPDAHTPLISGVNTVMDTVTAVGLAQRSKILLNLHRGHAQYFEWHRIVIHGIWQKCLVLSEPCNVAPPFEAGEDFAEAPIIDIPQRIEYYLSSAEGRSEAEKIADYGFLTLNTRCRLADSLELLLSRLDGNLVRGEIFER